MKASELIEELQQAIELWGDCNVEMTVETEQGTASGYANYVGRCENNCGFGMTVRTIEISEN